MNSRRSASRSCVSATLRMVTTLPSDFDIFSPPSVSRPVCIQCRAKLPGAERALGLRDLVLVVREDQVGAAAVDVERLAEVAVRHRRALDVPARAARSPRARPTTARPAWPPSTARSRAGSASARPPRRARPPSGRRCSGPRACRRPANSRTAIVDVAAGRVGEPLLLEAADDVDHLGDVLGRARLDVGRRQAEGARCRRSSSSVYSRATSVGGCALVVGLADDLVVDVGDVADEA